MAQKSRKKNKNKEISFCINAADLGRKCKAKIKKLITEKLYQILEEGNFLYADRLYISMNIGNVLTKNFKNLNEMEQVLRTDKDCKLYLEALIWGGIPVSPFDETSKVYKCKGGRYKCKNSNRYFNILTGTMFENTKIPLKSWFKAIYLQQAIRRGISSIALAEILNVTQSTAWYMLHKIRKCMEFENHQKLDGTVEMDEYYEGGLKKNMHYPVKLAMKENQTTNKKVLQGFAQRGGNAVIRPIPNTEADTLNAGVLKYVKTYSTLYSDDNQSYKKIPFDGYERGIVTHSKKIYVDKNNKNIHTNTVESLWSTFQKTISTYVHISQKHLQNYANECVFRYNTKKMKPIDACVWLLQNVMCTRITRKEIARGLY